MDQNSTLVYLDNQATDEYEYEEEYSFVTPTKCLFISIYFAIILVSLTGNVLVCWTIGANRVMRTTTNLLIVSLAISDIMMAVFNIPFDIIMKLPVEWPFGEFICRLVPTIQMTSIYVSTYTMMQIAIYRLWLVRQRTNPKAKPNPTSTKLKATIVSTWLASLILSLTEFFTHKTKIEDSQLRCSINMPEIKGFDLKFVLALFMLITQYVVPLTITLWVYIAIGRVIAENGKMIGTQASESKKREIHQTKRRRIFMLALVVATFAVCWAPANLYILFEHYTEDWYYTGEIWAVFHCLAISSVCYNPIIYFWFNEKFRFYAKQSIFNPVINFFRCSSRTQTTEENQHNEKNIL